LQFLQGFDTKANLVRNLGKVRCFSDDFTECARKLKDTAGNDTTGKAASKCGRK